MDTRVVVGAAMGGWIIGCDLTFSVSSESELCRFVLVDSGVYTRLLYVVRAS